MTHWQLCLRKFQRYSLRKSSPKNLGLGLQNDNFKYHSNPNECSHPLIHASSLGLQTYKQVCSCSTKRSCDICVDTWVTAAKNADLRFCVSKECQWSQVENTGKKHCFCCTSIFLNTRTRLECFPPPSFVRFPPDIVGQSLESFIFDDYSSQIDEFAISSWASSSHVTFLSQSAHTLSCQR